LSSANKPTPVVIITHPAQFDQLYFPMIATAAPVMIANGAMVKESGKVCTLDLTGLDPWIAWK
jgi:hypothetical protein